MQNVYNKTYIEIHSSWKISANVENFYMWGFKAKTLNFYFPEQIFFRILTCSISHMYNLDYFILKHSDTNVYKLSENTYFYQVIFHKICLLYIFCWGRSKFGLWSKTICAKEWTDNWDLLMSFCKHVFKFPLDKEV